MEGELRNQIISLIKVWQSTKAIYDLDALFKIIDDMQNELMNNPALMSYEEIAVPDAWDPWFKKYFGCDKRYFDDDECGEERRL